MKHPLFSPILVAVAGLIFLFACSNKTGTSTETVTDAPNRDLVSVDESMTDPPFGALFEGSPDGEYGATGCIHNGTNCTGTPPGGEWASYDPQWETYFSYDDTSMTITANDSCRSVTTAPNNNCIFTVGDNGITQISFDFAISGDCHDPNYGTDWLAFWIYSDPWESTAEVDFLEACSGPNRGGLNTNFDGHCCQIGLFEQDTPDWQGSITAKFSGSGDNVYVRVSNSINDEIASTYLARDSGYLFVLDTSPTLAPACTVTISNLSMKGSVGASGQGCVGLVSGT